MITFHVKSFRFIVWNGGVAEWIIVIIKKNGENLLTNNE
jgi:hypothetical protein